jgi:hypothetical protein
MRAGFVIHPDRRRGLVRIAGRSKNPDHRFHRPCLRGCLMHWDCGAVRARRSRRRTTAPRRSARAGRSRGCPGSDYLARLPATRNFLISSSLHLRESSEAAYARVWRNKAGVARTLRCLQALIGTFLYSGAPGLTIGAKTPCVGSTFPDLGESGPTWLQSGGRASVYRVEDGPMWLLGPSS